MRDTAHKHRSRLRRVAMDAGLLYLLLAPLAMLLAACEPLDTPLRVTPWDRLSLYVAAWNRTVGDSPLGHPRGPTPLVCLVWSPRLAQDMQTPRVSRAVREAVAATLERRSFLLTDGCITNQGQSPSWVQDAGGRPAVAVLLWPPHFEDPDHARLRVERIAGGTHALTEECDYVREEDGAWRVNPESCLQAQS